MPAELHALRKRNGKGPIFLRAVSPMAESESLILAIAYLFFLLAGLFRSSFLLEDDKSAHCGG